MAKTRSEITQAIRDSRRWTAEQAAAVLAAAGESGLSVRAFAIRHGLDPQRLTRWRSQLAGPQPADRTFVEITALATAHSSTSGFEVALRLAAAPEAQRADRIRSRNAGTGRHLA